MEVVVQVPRPLAGDPVVARRYWTCRKCAHRNERTASRTCQGCGEKTKPAPRGPKHLAGLKSFDEHARVQREVHGLDENVCAICEKPSRDGRRHDRDHAHFDGGYPRGLLCWYCNKRLGEVERGNDGEAWLEAALAYVRRARAHHEEQAA